MDFDAKVTTLVAHCNVFGAAEEKQPGDRYSLPAATAEALAASGIVDIISGTAADALAPVSTGKTAGKAGA